MGETGKFEERERIVQWERQERRKKGRELDSDRGRKGGRERENWIETEGGKGKELDTDRGRKGGREGEERKCRETKGGRENEGGKKEEKERIGNGKEKKIFEKGTNGYKEILGLIVIKRERGE